MTNSLLITCLRAFYSLRTDFHPFLVHPGIQINQRSLPVLHTTGKWGSVMRSGWKIVLIPSPHGVNSC
ncbi:MAG: hypothetical protein V7K20_17640 [Nostoc sp.]